MSKILMPSSGPDAWRQFLAKPDLHWATGYSARTMAHAWGASDGLPPEIAAALTAAFGQVEALVVIPERTAVGGCGGGEHGIGAAVTAGLGCGQSAVSGDVAGRAHTCLAQQGHLYRLGNGTASTTT